MPDKKHNERSKNYKLSVDLEQGQSNIKMKTII
jgi:hypothetical protein